MDANCCKLEPTEAEIIQSEYYGVFYNTLNAMINDGWKAELFGKIEDATKYYNKINDFNYLFMYLQFIKLQQQDDNAGNDCGQTYNTEHYFELYQLSCIAKYFECNGFNISKLYDVFNLNPKNSLDGINFMCIEDCETDCNNPLFIINKT